MIIALHNVGILGKNYKRGEVIESIPEELKGWYHKNGAIAFANDDGEILDYDPDDEEIEEEEYEEELPEEELLEEYEDPEDEPDIAAIDVMEGIVADDKPKKGPGRRKRQ